MKYLKKTILTLTVLAISSPSIAAGWQSLYNADGTPYSEKQYSELVDKKMSATLEDGSPAGVQAILNKTGDKVWLNIDAYEEQLGQQAVVTWDGFTVTSLAGVIPTRDNNSKILNTASNKVHAVLDYSELPIPTSRTLIQSTDADSKGNFHINPWWIAGVTDIPVANPLRIIMDKDRDGSVAHYQIQSLGAYGIKLEHESYVGDWGHFDETHGTLLACDGSNVKVNMPADQKVDPFLLSLTDTPIRLDVTEQERILEIYLDKECEIAVPSL